MKNVVFDIGWVLVHLDYRPLFGLLESRGVTHDGLEDLTGRIALQEHESGRLDGHGLLDNIVALAPQRVTHAEAEAAWKAGTGSTCCPMSGTCTGRGCTRTTASARWAMARWRRSTRG